MKAGVVWRVRADMPTSIPTIFTATGNLSVNAFYEKVIKVKADEGVSDGNVLPSAATRPTRAASFSRTRGRSSGRDTKTPG
jgi:hypothetical protein